MCLITKDVNNFTVGESRCKPCRNTRLRDIYATDPLVRDKSRRRQYKHRYGITSEQRDEMFVVANNRCAICGDRAEAVDHNHETGKIRGVLCKECNMGLGLFDDCPEILIEAASYLRKEGQ